MKTKSLKNWWSFLRFQNILIIILTQYLIQIFVIEKNIETINLSPVDFFILVITTAIIAIGGNLINDIYDYPIDKINKAEKTFINQLITEKNSWKAYYLTHFVAILGSVYFYFFTNWQVGIIYFLGTPLLLWLYSWKLKKTALFGNLLIALICALVPIMLIHAVYPTAEEGFLFAKVVIGFYALFAFLTTLYREIVKDIEDKEGDKRYGSRSLPIVFGQQIAKNTALLVGTLLLIILIYLVSEWEDIASFQLIYILVLLLIPIIFSIIQLIKAKEKKDFHQISQIIKWIMFFGLLFLIFI